MTFPRATNPSRRRRVVSAALMSLLLVGPVYAFADSSEQRKERFKLLLESPPALEHLLFREKLGAVLNRPISLDRGIRDSTNYALFELRWQTNALFVRSLGSVNDLTNTKISQVAFTVWNDEFCFLDAGTNALMYHLEHERVGRGQVPPAFDGAWFRITRYGEILNLGLSHLWPGSVRWSGDTFTARGLADKKPMFVSGAISRFTNGIPCELSVLYSNNMGVAQYRIAYEYPSYTPPFFPGRITLFFEKDGKEVEFRSYEILSLKSARRPMGAEFFAPDPFLRNNRMPVHYFTNDSTYIRFPSGALMEISASPPPLKLSRTDLYRNRYFYLATALLTFLFIGILVSARKNKPDK